MARDNKVTRFYRGARRHPRWDMGTPPNPRGTSPFRRARRRHRLADPVVYLKLVLGVAVLGLVILPVAGDAVNALWGGRTASSGCRVVNVIDGDTVSIYCPSRGLERARLAGFDTPEQFKPRCPSEFARAVAATWTLRRLLWQAERIGMVRTGSDRYGRALIFMALDDVPVSGLMIQAGHARPYDGGARQGWCSA